MKALPYYKMYPSDAETDAHFRAMNDQELGFYWRCLNHAWINCGLPADPDERARTFRVSKSYEAKLWKRVGKCFSLDGEKLVNKRQEEEREKALLKSERATDSIRIRYERRSNVSPRAVARPDSDSESSSGVCVSEGGLGETKPEPLPELVLYAGGGISATALNPAMQLDEAWMRYVSFFAHGGKAVSIHDLNTSFGRWNRMDFEEKLQATQHAERMCQTASNGQYIKNPKYHLDEKPWTGRALPRTIETVKPGQLSIHEKAKKLAERRARYEQPGV